MDALARQRVEIRRQRRHQGLAFAGPHLGDLAAMKHHAADHLDVVMALPEHALGGLAHRGEGFGQQIVEAFRSEEHTSELQSLMRISYAVFCLKKKKKHNTVTMTIVMYTLNHSCITLSNTATT